MENECPICYDELSNENSIIVCWNEHKLCETCYKTIMKHPRTPKCPMDRGEMFDYFDLRKKPVPKPRITDPFPTNESLFNFYMDKVVAISTDLSILNGMSRRALRSLYVQINNFRNKYGSTSINTISIIFVGISRQTIQENVIAIQNKTSELLNAFFVEAGQNTGVGQIQRCGICRQQGHNRRSCPQNTN